MDKVNKKKIIMIILLILGGILALLASAYAFYSFKATSSDGNLSSGGIYLEYIEGVEGISLSNALPLLDEEGIVSEDGFTFEVNGFSNGINTLVEYSISVVDGDVPAGYTEENRIDDIAVKVYLEDSNGNKLYLGSPSNNEIIYRNVINGGTRNNLINNTYTLRMWISDKVLISNTNDLNDYPDYDILYTPEAYKTKFASIKINIDGTSINSANAPDLDEGMIPIKYDETSHEWVKANINNANNDWYDYYNKKWANVALVKEVSTNNTTLEGSMLPSEYTQLEYIESTGTQYIDTGYRPNNKTKVYMKYELTTLDKQSGTWLFGYQKGYTQTSFQRITWSSLNNNQFRFGNALNDTLNSELLNTIYEEEFSSEGWIINGVLNTVEGVEEFVCEQNATIFGGRNGNDTVSFYSNFKLYSTKLYDNNVLIRNFVPAKRNSDNEIGMYDTVNNVFYTNSGTGDFIAGPSTCTGTNNYCTRSDYMNASVGTVIPEEDILGYFVWIPRYKYKLFNVSTDIEVNPQEIQIDFEKGMETTGLASGLVNGEYLTHPAFTFGEDELTGIWVGKFETSSSTLDATSTTCRNSASDGNCNNANILPSILPNVNSLRYQQVANQYLTSLKFAGGTLIDGVVSFAGNTTYGLTQNTDSHMMKNTEWGAVSYLSHSKYGINSEIYINNSSSFITGRSGGNVGGSVTPTTIGGTAQYTSTGYYTYDGKCATTSGTVGTLTECIDTTSFLNDPKKGTNSSSTGNIYGIYDMSGGAWEYVMGVMEDTNDPSLPRSGYTGRDYTVEEASASGLNAGSAYSGLNINSGFNGMLYGKNYDVEASTWVTMYKEDGLDFPNSKYYNLYGNTTTRILGDATRETAGWYGDSKNWLIAGSPWFFRGGGYNAGASAGAFVFHCNSGQASLSYSYRVVLARY